MATLNEYQLRGLSVTLRVLEENLLNIKQIMDSDDYHGVLLDKTSNIHASIEEALLRRALFIKAKIQAIAERFGLEKVHKEVGNEISSELSYCWEILQDAKADKLKRYGEVEEGIKDILDPDLDAIIALLDEMQKCLTDGD